MPPGAGWGGVLESENGKDFKGFITSAGGQESAPKTTAFPTDGSHPRVTKANMLLCCYELCYYELLSLAPYSPALRPS